MADTHSAADKDRPAMRLAISPCPNDTFVFCGIASGRLGLEGVEISTVFEDVETLNQAALEGEHEITKLSCYAYLLVRAEYQLLRTGAALGYGCGPLLVSPRAMSARDLKGARVLVPGALTTAHLLLRLYDSDIRDKVFVRYDQVIPLLRAGEADAGVIIHEDRFLYEQMGLRKLADLGQWWEQETGAPIPLGCVAMKRALAPAHADAFDALVRRSIALSTAEPEQALPFIRAHSQSMDRSVLERHIAAFVTARSWDLGPEGDRAVAALSRLAVQAGIVA